MEYLIPLVILILLIAGFVTFLVFNSTRKSGPEAATGDEGAPGMGRDDTPLGDTTQHAGEQSRDGTTVGGQDADDAGGSGRPVESGYGGTSAAGEQSAAAPDPDSAAHVARPGEAEGHERLHFDGQRPGGGNARPESERLADRDG